MAILTLRSRDGNIHKVNSELLKYSYTLKKLLEHVDIPNYKEGDIISLPYSDSQLVKKCISFVKLQSKYIQPTHKYPSTDYLQSDSGSSDGSEITQTYYLESSDKIAFKVDLNIIKESKVLEEIVTITEDSDNIIPLPKIHSKILRHIVDWAKLKQQISSDKNNNFSDFFKKLEKYELFELLNAANYLEISVLFDAAASKIANYLYNTSHDDLRLTFGLKDDLTKEFKEKIIEENELVN